MAAGLVLIGLLFAAEGSAAVEVWRHSTAYGHCFLVLPIAFWLLWERRALLAAWQPRLTLWPVIPAILLAAAWCGADLLGVMEGRQLAAIGFIELLLLALLGWRLWWGLSPGLLYLFFLVPFGAFLTPALQRFTAGFIVHGLDFLRIPYEADSFRITIPEGVFYVAEACAGLRFLIASVAFGVLYAVTMFRSPERRIAFIAIACVVPVLANGVRGLGIVLLGHGLGSAEAGAADHIIYGWVFFSMVILLLAFAGLPFREDAAPPAPLLQDTPGPAARPVRAWVVAASIVLVACVGPLAMLGIGQGRDAGGAPARPALVTPVGCSAGAWQVTGDTGAQDFACQGGVVRIIASSVPAGANPARVLDAGRGPAMAQLGGDVDLGRLDLPGADPAAWVLLTDRDSGRVAAYFVSIDGRPALGGLRDRLRLVRAMFERSPMPSIAVVASAPNAEVLEAFLSAQTRLGSAFSSSARRTGGFAGGRPPRP
jgi:exosortase A